MNNYIINHLFEFWEHIGLCTNFLNRENGYTYTVPHNKSWPSKVFAIDSEKVNFEKLYSEMKIGTLPKSLGVMEDEVVEKRLLQHGFEQTSIVKAMVLKLSEVQKPIKDFLTIIQVDNDDQAIEFSKIASQSFGYDILPSTVVSILNNSVNMKLFIGKHVNKFVSCGMIYLDKKGVSGIHMIGTLSEYRGLGLGKIMTDKLINEAYKNQSREVVLVASKSGERIYAKKGFITKGALKSFVIKV